MPPPPGALRLVFGSGEEVSFRSVFQGTRGLILPLDCVVGADLEINENKISWEYLVDSSVGL